MHRHSRWRSGKFVAINCAAIPESLIESELFGYQPGAFTGASKNGYIGKIREADGGVLFLDEIGDMPLALQTRLLRVLQEKEVAPLGASRSVPVNFALICATHRNLTQRVSAGEFREDLLWRLREYALALPPAARVAGAGNLYRHPVARPGRCFTPGDAFKRAAGSPQPAAVAGKRTPAAERPEGNAGSRR